MLPKAPLLVAALVASCTAQYGVPQASPQQVVEVLQPKLTFDLREADYEAAAAAEAAADGSEPWRRQARTVATLQQMHCADDILGATASMLDAAEGGDSLAMAALGTMYTLGQECSRKRNLTWGVHWLGRAATLGQADAQATLAFLHDTDALRLMYNYTEVAFGKERAAPLYEAAAKGGSAYALAVLGYRFATGAEGTTESCPAATAYYEPAAVKAVQMLDGLRLATAEAHAASNPAEQDHKTLLSRKMAKEERIDAAAVEYMDYCAHVGDATGRAAMAHFFHAGSNNVAKDRKVAEHWFNAAAHQGEASGHANLGLMQLRSRKYNKAVRSLRRAAKLGDPSGWAGLGYAYLHGAGLGRDDRLGAKAIYTAAKQGHLDAIYNMGVLTMTGRGVKADVRTAYRFWAVAAEFAHAQAQLQTGRMLSRGLGVHKSCQTAQFYLKHAFESGPAMRSLLSVGLRAHMEDRPQRALTHYLLAANAGSEVGQHNAAFLFAERMAAQPLAQLEPRHAFEYGSRATKYFKLAALQGSAEAQVQLGMLVSKGGSNHAMANELFTAAYQAGSKDALWHLGYNYWKGRGGATGKETNRGLALKYWKLAGFDSKHSKLRGLEAIAFGMLRLGYKARVPLMLVAVVATLFATGNPLEMLANARSSGAGSSIPQWEDEEGDDDFDDFDED